MLSVYLLVDLVLANFYKILSLVNTKRRMSIRKLPNSTAVYFLALVSMFIFCFAGIGIIPAIIAYIVALKSEKVYRLSPAQFNNFGTIRKGKIIAIIGIILTLIIISVAIWTLITIGWDAWSDEFVRKWNEGLESSGAY